MLGPTLRISDSVGLGQGLRSCMSEFPGGAAAAGPQNNILRPMNTEQSRFIPLALGRSSASLKDMGCQEVSKIFGFLSARKLPVV